MYITKIIGAKFHGPMYLIRPITKRISHDRLHHWLSRSVPRLLRISTWLRDRVPFIGRQLGALIPVANYNGVFPTDSVELLEQYSILDTFDTLSPKNISPQRPDTVRQWFINAGYEDIEFDTATVFYMRGKRKLAKNTTNIPCRPDPFKGNIDAAAF